jgi:dTDP-4-dehydrorhamnose 3,5-epimerase
MEIVKTKSGCLIIPIRCIEDRRGFFSEVFRKEWGLPEFVQDNCSTSIPGVVRGLHFQKKNPQGKYVRCLSGLMLDVAVDLRIGSATYGRVDVFQLSPTGDSVYIPPGFAHGFMAIDRSVLYYKCTTYYDADSDGGINPMDDSMNLPWIGRKDLIVSDKDLSLPKIADFWSPFSF